MRSKKAKYNDAELATRKAIATVIKLRRKSSRQSNWENKPTIDSVKKMKQFVGLLR